MWIMLFLDMEKAFDRVSYDFTLRGLESLGFRPKFRKWVGMMYDTNNAPQRRMYVNGYYSVPWTISSADLVQSMIIQGFWGSLLLLAQKFTNNFLQLTHYSKKLAGAVLNFRTR